MSNELLLEMLSTSIICSVIASQLIQKLKQSFNLGTIFNKILSIIISIAIGITYSLSFCSDSIVYAIWVSLFTLIGAEGLYKVFKGKFGLNSLDIGGDNNN